MTPIQSRSSAALHSGLYSDAPSRLRDVTSFAMSAGSSTWLIGGPEARRIGARSERSELRDDPAITHQTPVRGDGCPALYREWILESLPFAALSILRPFGARLAEFQSRSSA